MRYDACIRRKSNRWWLSLFSFRSLRKIGSMYFTIVCSLLPSSTFSILPSTSSSIFYYFDCCYAHPFFPLFFSFFSTSDFVYMKPKQSRTSANYGPAHKIFARIYWQYGWLRNKHRHTHTQIDCAIKIVHCNFGILFSLPPFRFLIILNWFKREREQESVNE